MADDEKISIYQPPIGGWTVSKPPPWKPNRFQRWMVKKFFGWEWFDAG